MAGTEAKTGAAVEAGLGDAWLGWCITAPARVPGEAGAAEVLGVGHAGAPIGTGAPIAPVGVDLAARTRESCRTATYRPAALKDAPATWGSKTPCYPVAT